MQITLFVQLRFLRSAKRSFLRCLAEEEEKEKKNQQQQQQNYIHTANGQMTLKYYKNSGKKVSSFTSDSVWKDLNGLELGLLPLAPRETLNNEHA